MRISLQIATACLASLALFLPGQAEARFSLDAGGSSSYLSTRGGGKIRAPGATAELTFPASFMRSD